MDPLPDIAAVAELVADASRAAMLMELVDGSERPASRLAEAASVSASTASAHLARLQDAGFVEVRREGRHRRFRIADPQVVVLLEALLALSETPSAVGLRSSMRWQRLRVARTCYDHLAGTLGTDVLAGLVEGGALLRTDGHEGSGRSDGDPLSAPVPRAPYALGPRADDAFGALGIDLADLERRRRPLLRVCSDWTEQRHHLAGGLGAAVAEAFVDRGWVARRADARDLAVREPGRIAAWLQGV
ncbi:helix-turn-helix transcriptional regulator [Brachybacterium sp. MASK1Z-5]|uniref:Helix-turn-helix transcriptional regulator n=1 Tax=Brachybacterium halotolerans TaxID=2795215 RepID=A0ABS1B5Q5_9MICO|nr:helix-turn-helix transcriptional regulator [Brachybacterium halotolerans]MBK0329951.1 helix-turn-helix transcriptional regulator [Brachybacterium halotolerans]